MWAAPLVLTHFGLQFTVLSKAAKITAPKTIPAAHHKAKKDSTMSAEQAALIVSLRAAVDKRLDTLGHTCEFGS